MNTFAILLEETKEKYASVQASAKTLWSADLADEYISDNEENQEDFERCSVYDFQHDLGLTWRDFA